MAREVLTIAQATRSVFLSVRDARQAARKLRCAGVRVRAARWLALALLIAFGPEPLVCAPDAPPATVTATTAVPAGFDSKGFLPLPIMFGPDNGWWEKVNGGKIEILHTIDGGKTWRDVTPDGVPRAVAQQPKDHLEDEFLSELVDLDPLDASRLWLAAPLFDDNQTLVAYTADGGQHWVQNTAPVCNDGASISFLDEQRGFLLNTSAPALGHMDKEIYGTEDGGKRWFVLSAPSAGAYYVGGFSFRSPLDGWIGGTYHGGDMVPLYHTVDGARTWALQELPVPKEFAQQKGDYYGDVDSPAFTGPERRQGTLHVSLRHHVGQKPYFDAEVDYQSGDGGRTWHLPVEGVKIVKGEE